MRDPPDTYDELRSLVLNGGRIMLRVIEVADDIANAGRLRRAAEARLPEALAEDLRFMTPEESSEYMELAAQLINAAKDAYGIND